MSNFTKLEQAAPHAVFTETPKLTSILEQQFKRATVTNRENTGAGFFTTIAVPEDAPLLDSPRVLGSTTHARIERLTYGLGFVLFMEDGQLHLLEGYTVGPKSTAPLNLGDLAFTITETPFDA